MKKAFMKVVLPISILLILIYIGVVPIKAVYQSDPLNDVWSRSSANSGDYTNYIDLSQVVHQGSSIMIKTDGSLVVLGSTIRTYFLILLSNDGDPTNFEASFMFSQIGTKNRYVAWTLNDPCADTEVTWETDYSGSHYKLDNDNLQINFIEFSDIILSENLIISVSKVSGKEYCDWIPNIYHTSYIQQLIDKILQSLSVLNPTSTTTSQLTTSQPITSIPTTTTTTSSTSIPPTSTTSINTSPIIIPTTTTNTSFSDTISDDLTSYSISKGITDSITSGYTILLVLAIIPSLITIKRVLKKRKI